MLGDPLLIALGLLAVAAGALAVYAVAQASGVSATNAAPDQALTREVVNIVAAFGVGAVASAVGHRNARIAAWPLFGVVAVALSLVLVLGSTVNGASAWFTFGSVQVEPSQVAVLALVLLLAARLHDPSLPASEQALHVRQLPVPLAAIMSIAVLVLAEPALGMAAVIVAVGMIMVASGGLRRQSVVLLMLATALTAGAVTSLHLIKPYQERRITAFVHPEPNTTAGYQTQQSVIAVGAGGLTGQGLFGGTQTSGQFVPEQRTDFVFTVVAEETGFVGSAGLLLLLTGLSLRALTIARNGLDRYSQLLAAGIGMWWALQAFVNIGMTIGVLPVTGIPLPFISYGGTGVLIDFVGVGLLTSISRESRRHRISAGPAIV